MSPRLSRYGEKSDSAAVRQETRIRPLAGRNEKTVGVFLSFEVRGSGGGFSGPSVPAAAVDLERYPEELHS